MESEPRASSRRAHRLAELRRNTTRVRIAANPDDYPCGPLGEDIPQQKPDWRAKQISWPIEAVLVISAIAIITLVVVCVR